jgi:hypothetical protein
MLSDKRNIKPKQSLLDLAVQHYGSVEGVLDLVQSGQFSSFTEETDASKTIVVGEVLDPDVVAQLKRLKVSPTSSKKAAVVWQGDVDLIDGTVVVNHYSGLAHWVDVVDPLGAIVELSGGWDWNSVNASKAVDLTHDTAIANCHVTVTVIIE